MADTTEQRLESALNIIGKIAEEGGYMKRETKNDLQEAVSEIRKYFKILKKNPRTEK